MKTSKKILSLLLIAAMLVSVLCMGVSASDYAEVSISEGEPVTISWSGTTGTVVSVDGSSYIPRQFILWVRNGFTVSVDGTALTPNSAPSADDTDVAYTINTDATNAITIVASNGTTTYTITCPHYTAIATGINPVDVNGNPVQLSSVRYVRVYSAVLFSAGVFGETSAEVCGLYVANGDGSGAATTTPTVKVGTSTVTTSNMGTVTKKVYSATTKVTVTSGAENIYVNGEKVTSGTEITFSTPSGSTNYVQVITQSGTEAPYITMVKITR